MMMTSPSKIHRGATMNSKKYDTQTQVSALSHYIDFGESNYNKSPRLDVKLSRKKTSVEMDDILTSPTQISNDQRNTVYGTNALSRNNYNRKFATENY
jgi:hypothetical protein